MREEGKPKRLRERLELRLPIRVRCRETVDFEWTEITRLIDVTPFGCGFPLKRPVETGRLLYLTIPMPRQLRVFDHVEDQYRVWALVRHVKPVVAEGGAAATFEIGVAFIGKHPPRSYEGNPAKRYSIADEEADRVIAVADWAPDDSASTDKRNQTRHNIPVEMLVETLDEKGDVVESEQTVTENISNSGAAIYSTLKLLPGRFIRVTSQEYKLTVYAAVRGQSVGPSGIPRIHIEFIDRQWPL